MIDDADATAQRATLGLGTIATQAASAVAITGGSVTGITDLAIADGGTGASTAIAAADALATKSSNIASATTTDLSTATGTLVHITGTTTITGLGTVTAGIERVCVFDGILTLTHNGTSLILPGAANIITGAGDCGVFRSEGSGNWRCIGFVRAAVAPTSTGAASWGGSAITGAASAFLVDWAPTGYADCLLATITGSGGATLVSIAGGVDGRILIVRNGMTGSGAITLVLEDGGFGSTASMRIANPNGSSTAAYYVFSCNPGDSYIFRYSGAKSRWELLKTPSMSPYGGIGECQFAYYDNSQFTNGTGLWGSTGINAYTHGQTNSLVAAGIETVGRIQEVKGGDVVSANEMTLPGWIAGTGSANVGYAGNVHKVTGATTIKGIDTTGWQAGSRIRLTFDSTITIQDGFGPTAPVKTIYTKSGCNLEMQAGEYLTLYYDGTSWNEV